MLLRSFDRERSVINYLITLSSILMCAGLAETRRSLQFLSCFVAPLSSISVVLPRYESFDTISVSYDGVMPPMVTCVLGTTNISIYIINVYIFVVPST